MSAYTFQPFFSLLPQQNMNGASHSVTPRMDVYESATDNLVTAVLELPGMTKENVSIDVQGNQLVVTGEQRQERERAEGNYVQKERPAGKYFRTLPLPSGTRAESIKASMENGVLTISFPKSTPAQAPQKISIA